MKFPSKILIQLKLSMHPLQAMLDPIFHRLQSLITGERYLSANEPGMYGLVHKNLRV